METLFPIDDPIPSMPSIGTRVEWSFSKRQMLFQCPRKYYYQYYGASARTAKSDSHKMELRQAKVLKNLNLRAGEIVDIVIQTFLTKAAAREWTEDRLVSWARSILETDRCFNTSQIAQKEGAFTLPRLLEYAWQFPDTDERFQKAEAKVVTAIRNFYRSPAYSMFRAQRANVEAQKKIAIAVDGSRAVGKIDVLVVQADSMHILDWKLGRQGSADDHLQVGFYGLWAVRTQALARTVRLYMAYLGEGVVQEHTFPGALNLLSVKGRIVQDLNIMRQLHPYGAEGRPRAFTPCLQPRVCELCQFRKVCWPQEGL
jgi:PD-(D/E)XK nuclease superfamily